MLAALLFLAGGVPFGFLLRNSPVWPARINCLAMYSICAMLFILGAGIGNDAALFARIDELGGKALCVGFLSSIGSAVFMLPLRRLFGEAAKTHAAEGPGLAGTLKAMKGSLLILACFAAGLFPARAGLLPPVLCGGDLALYALWTMLFLVGMGLGFDVKAFGAVRGFGGRLVLVPMLTVAGTFAGAWSASLLLPGLSPGESFTAGSGFGYYSLSSVLITEAGYTALGSIALLANVFRELFTLPAAPVLVRLFGPLGPVAAAGAPAMDTCLPVILRFTDERFGIIAVFNGLVLTLAVPFIVPLCLRLL